MELENQVAEPQAIEPAGNKLDSIISDAIEKNTPAETPAVELEASAEPSKETTERVRDEHGRFAPKNTAATKAPDKGTATEAANTAQTKAVEPAPVEQPLEAPARWSDADKAAFAKLPKDAQSIIVERNKAMEADYTRKTQEIAETRKTYEPVVQELGKWDGYLKQLGIQPHQAIGQMLTVEYNLRTGTPEQKSQALAYLAQLYDAPIPNSSAGEPGTQPPVDQANQQLSRQVAELSRALNEIKSQTAQSERQRAEAEFAALGQAKDANGQAKYPHFEKVKQSMIQLVATNQADSWDTAYSKSVRLDDDLYKETVETERKRVADDLEKQRQEAIDKAKGARPVKTSSALPNGSTQGKDLDSIISGAMSKAGI